MSELIKDGRESSLSLLWQPPLVRLAWWSWRVCGVVHLLK